MKKIEFRLLKADEIEVRPQSIKNGKANMLLYMNSRVVTDLLDETVGNMNWTSEFYEVNNKLVCRIGIWDDDKNMFIYKSDTGTESNIEAEKGQFSDCYKRCLSRFGVVELYSSPKITIDDDGYGNTGCYVSLIRYDETSRKITELHICNKFDKEVFSWKFGEKKQTTSFNPNVEQNKKEDNISSLKKYCSTLKGKVNMNSLKEFYNFWSKKIESGEFKGTINTELLWKKWCEKK